MHALQSLTMLRLVVLFCAFIALATAQRTAVSRCTSNTGELPINAYIHGCTRPPCVLHQRQDAVINTLFRAPRAIQSMRTLATAYLSVGGINIPVPYDLREKSVTCNFLLNASCPLRANQNVEYQLRMHIDPSFPVGTSTNIEFRVVDQSNAPVWCLRVAVRIAGPRSGAREIDSEDVEQV